MRARFWVEAALAALTGLLTVLTLVSREWIEIVFGFSPDGGDGTLEWVIVVLLGLATAAFALLARAERRRPAAGAAR